MQRKFLSAALRCGSWQSKQELTIRVDLDEVAAALSTNGFDALEISNAHALKVAQLPPIHREPFDRMLVAQAMCEPLKLLTADSFLADYSALVEVI